jgi:6-phosphogluconolactonase (cycloisomerase 2 family)
MQCLSVRALCAYVAFLTSLAGCTNSDGSAGASASVKVTPSISGSVAVVVGASRTVAVTFTADDGNPAIALSLSTDLSRLPAGWSASSSSFSCSRVSTGNGCRLALIYAPASVGGGTLTLDYSYLDNTRAAKSGTINIPYTSTEHDNVVATTSPSGQVAGITGSTQTVGITFTTDDGNPASGLALSTNLATLPAGWSASAVSFACSTVRTGNGCRLTLTYAPSVAGGGMLSLDYGYNDNSGAAKTGSVGISYTSTAHDNVLAAVSPTGTVSVTVGGTRAVTVAFTTDDGSTASALSLTSDLTALPIGWSSTSTAFACATVKTGAACELPLIFAPASTGSGTLDLNYRYVDDAGTPQTGSASIPYAATVPQHIYIADYGANTVLVCPIAGDGSLGACQSTGSGFDTPEDIKIAGNLLYVVNYLSQSVSVCSINLDATLSGCVATGSGFTYPVSMAINAAGTLAYVSSYSHTPSVCAIDTSGLLTSCASTAGNVPQSWSIALSTDGGHAYLSSPWYGGINICAIASDGTLGSCILTGSSEEPFGIAIDGTNLYQADYGVSSVAVCPLNNDGSIGGCTTAGSGFASPIGLVLNGNLAYVSNYFSNSIGICPVSADGTFGACTTSTDASFNFIWGLAIH